MKLKITDNLASAREKNGCGMPDEVCILGATGLFETKALLKNKKI